MYAMDEGETLPTSSLACSVLGPWTTVFAVLGLAWALYTVLFGLVPYLYQAFVIHVICRCHGGPLLQLNQMGTWAVVMGCTDGIGKAYAEELARLGLNIVLISRNPNKLQDQAVRICQTFGVQTRVITADFSHHDIYGRLAIQLDGLDIGVLVNNVGMAVDPEYFIKEKTEVLQEMINCNVLSVTMMTAIVLPAMVHKRKGVVINVSSAAGCRPVPFMALYSSTKAMINNLTQALSEEYYEEGIVFQAVTPYVVATKMSKMADPTGVIIPTPQAYVRQALQSVGIRTVTPGYLWHDLQHVFISLLPVIFLTRSLAAFKENAEKRKKAMNSLHSGCSKFNV